MLSYREFQIRSLEAIYRDARFAPIFKPNDKYPTKGSARIAYGDILDSRYIIRDGVSDGKSNWDDQTRPVVARYNSIENLVDDGWKLD